MLEARINRARLIARSAFADLKANANRYRRRRLSLPQYSPARNGEPEIYFLTPDYNSPSGGIRVIYRHVDILNASGIPAAVVHQKRGFRCDWFENSTRVLDVGRCRLGENDLLVLPETDGDLFNRLSPGARHAIFNQNAHLTWLRDPGSVSKHLVDNPSLVGIVAVSQHNVDMLSYAFPALDIHRVHLGIDETLFYDDAAPRPQKITYMPRRGGDDLLQVLQLLKSRGALDGWEVVALDGLKHEEVASHLRTSRIFLAFTYQEGFGLPAAEAMACGNFVVGYHGHGGREFFRANFSAAVETGDVLEFARHVEAAILSDADDSASTRKQGRQAAEFIRANYRRDKEIEDVVRIYGALLPRKVALAGVA
ncbi:MAG: glycosyltransferase [Devosia sp.]|uniref:glycosyltransferase n=1 Tax=Devosia sp. TaxID=1871048 RepID=UPI003390DC8F